MFGWLITRVGRLDLKVAQHHERLGYGGGGGAAVYNVGPLRVTVWPQAPWDPQPILAPPLPQPAPAPPLPQPAPAPSFPQSAPALSFPQSAPALPLPRPAPALSFPQTAPAPSLPAVAGVKRPWLATHAEASDNRGPQLWKRARLDPPSGQQRHPVQPLSRTVRRLVPPPNPWI